MIIASLLEKLHNAGIKMSVIPQGEEILVRLDADKIKYGIDLYVKIDDILLAESKILNAISEIKDQIKL